MVRMCLGAVGFLVLAGCSSAGGPGGSSGGSFVPAQARQADKITWAGLDYSKVQMVGTNDFKDPKEIFPGFLQQWNGLFVKEMVDDLGKKLGKPIAVDLDSVTAQNLKATADQIIHKDGDRAEYVDKGHITKEDIAAAVKAYTLKEQSGIGLVFIVERLVKTYDVGCLYIVYFDLGTREVLACRRDVNRARGLGFRNFWFTPIKESVRNL